MDTLGRQAVQHSGAHTQAQESPSYDAVGRARIRQRLLPVAPDGGRLCGWLGPLFVTLVAGLLRFHHLGLPNPAKEQGKIFDEVYYAKEAHDLLGHGYELAANGIGPGFVVHPPLGKWTIAVGEHFFGYNTYGWRFSAAVVGTLMVLVLARLARRLTGSTALGCFAGLLLALDALHFVQSRVALLDIFLSAWILFAFGFLVLDRDWGRRRLADEVDRDGLIAGGGPWLVWRPYRLAAAVCLGAAVATKWNGLYALAVMALLAFAWDVGARRTAGGASPITTAVVRDAVPSLGWFLAVPVAVYLAAYSGWFASSGAYNREWAAKHPSTNVVSGVVPDALRSLWDYQKQMYHASTAIDSGHPYQSHPLGWLILRRPVAYYYESPKLGEMGCQVKQCAAEVLAIGTPFIWWVSIVALVGCIWLWLSRRDWRAAAVLAVVAMMLLPWEYFQVSDNRTMFLFYALPALPFLILAITLCAGAIWGGVGASLVRRRWAVIGIGAYTLLVVADFFGVPGIPGLGLYDILTGKVIPISDWNAKIWFRGWI